MPIPDTTPDKPRYSQTTKEVCNTFRILADCAQKGIDPATILDEEGKPKIRKLEMENYLLAVREILGTDEPLTPTLLNARLNYLFQNGKLKIHYPAGQKFCLAIIPCTQYGFPIKQDAIESGLFLRELAIDERDEKGELIEKNKISEKDNQLYEYLPDEVRKCLFKIESYDEKPEFKLTDDDRKRAVKAYKGAYKNAQTVFNQAKNRSKN